MSVFVLSPLRPPPLSTKYRRRRHPPPPLFPYVSALYCRTPASSFMTGSFLASLVSNWSTSGRPTSKPVNLWPAHFWPFHFYPVYISTQTQPTSQPTSQLACRSHHSPTFSQPRDKHRVSRETHAPHAPHSCRPCAVYLYAAALRTAAAWRRPSQQTRPAHIVAVGPAPNRSATVGQAPQAPNRSVAVGPTPKPQHPTPSTPSTSALTPSVAFRH